MTDLSNITGLSTKAYHILKKHHITYIEDLQKVTAEEFLQWVFREKAVLEEVLQTMKRYHVTFKGESE